MSENFILVNKADAELLMQEVNSNSQSFGELPIRTNYEGSAHTEVEDIILRGPVIYPTDELIDLQNRILCTDYIYYKDFPNIRKAVMELMHWQDGEMLGRVIITKLPPGGKITPHVDEGEAANFYSRYHFILQGAPGNNFTSGDDTQEMLTGQVWYINNHILHSVHNESDQDRVHLIVDIRSIQPDYKEPTQ